MLVIASTWTVHRTAAHSWRRDSRASIGWRRIAGSRRCGVIHGVHQFGAERCAARLLHLPLPGAPAAYRCCDHSHIVADDTVPAHRTVSLMEQIITLGILSRNDISDDIWSAVRLGAALDVSFQAQVVNPPPGYRFHTRCRLAMRRCRVDEPATSAIL